MSVQVQGNITTPVAITEPSSPFAGADVVAGTTATVKVGPYTNGGANPVTLSGISVTEAQNCTVNSAQFEGAQDSVTVDPGSTASIDVSVSVPEGATGSYSFTVADLTVA